MKSPPKPKLSVLVRLVMPVPRLMTSPVPISLFAKNRSSNRLMTSVPLGSIVTGPLPRLPPCWFVSSPIWSVPLLMKVPPD